MKVVPTSKHSSLLWERRELYLAPVAALIYPAALWCFHLSVSAFEAGSHAEIAFAAAVAALCLSFVLPGLILFTALRLAAIEDPSLQQLRAREIAFLSVAAPTIFVFLGVLLYMIRNPVPDGVAWTAIWIAAIGFVGYGDFRKRGGHKAISVRRTTTVRVAHGISASVIVLLFLALHIGNHLLGLFGADTHAAFMKIARHVYRAKVVEPVLVGLMLFQAVSGLWLTRRHMEGAADRFRAFQLASGIYLAFYVIGHMDSVFILARSYLGIDTDWAFATGAPQGLIRDPWNIRLVPHYWFGVFFVLSHLSSGLRIILITHGWRRSTADRIMIGGSVIGALVATLIMLGMCGMRVQFA